MEICDIQPKGLTAYRGHPLNYGLGITFKRVAPSDRLLPPVPHRLRDPTICRNSTTIWEADS